MTTDYTPKTPLPIMTSIALDTARFTFAGMDEESALKRVAHHTKAGLEYGDINRPPQEAFEEGDGDVKRLALAAAKAMYPYAELGVSMGTRWKADGNTQLLSCGAHEKMDFINAANCPCMACEVLVRAEELHYKNYADGHYVGGNGDGS